MQHCCDLLGCSRTMTRCLRTNDPSLNFVFPLAAQSRSHEHHFSPIAVKHIEHHVRRLPQSTAVRSMISSASAGMLAIISRMARLFCSFSMWATRYSRTMSRSPRSLSGVVTKTRTVALTRLSTSVFDSTRSMSTKWSFEASASLGTS